MCVIEHMEGKWYAFDFKEAATVPWMVAVPNVVDVLYVCRLHQTGGLPLTDFEVARELLNHGIGFSHVPFVPLQSLSQFVYLTTHLCEMIIMRTSKKMLPSSATLT
jgi:hypothetical protein